MSSSVFFKFKSQREPSRVTFDGTGISVFELKREIITINRLGDGTDFDLAIYNEDTNEEYSDDTTIIPRSTSIIARRLPATRYGKGTAQRYVSGKMPVNALNSSRLEKPIAKPMAATAPSASAIKPAISEEDRIAQMFAADAQQWEQQQQVMATATPVFRPGQAFKGKPGALAAVPNHPPPTGYLCYRCGEKGHWIQQCPTNADPNFDNRPRVKRTTGIPRSFLKTVEKPAETDENGIAPSGVMVNAEGEFVVAEPDKASWEQFQAKAKVSDAAKESSGAESKAIQDLGLECPIDKKLFVEPVKTPCCGKTYCLECITNALFDSDFVCPNCETEGTLIDDLVPDEEAVTKIKDYLQEKKDVAAAEKPEQNSPKIAADDSDNVKKAPSEEAEEKPEAPTSLVSGKKRFADGELDSAPASKRGSKPTTPLPVDINEKKGTTSEQSVPVIPTAGIQPSMSPTFPNPMMPMMPNGMMNPMFGMPGMGNMMMPFPNMPFPPQGQFFGNMGPGQGQWDNSFGNMQGSGNMMPGYGQNMGYGGGPGNYQMPTPDYNSQGNYGNPQHRVFNAAPQNNEDNAYFRPPVNPQRHQSKQRRVRPSDYRELG